MGVHWTVVFRVWTHSSEILYDIHIFSFNKMHLKISSAKCRSFCLGLNVLIMSQRTLTHRGREKMAIHWNGKQSRWHLDLGNAGCFSCDQAALRTLLSVWPSDSLSACHIFDNVRVIVISWNFQELLPFTDPMSMQKVKVEGQGHRGQSKFCPKFGSFRTITPVWIHRWLRNDAQRLNWVRIGALWFFTVISQISRSQRTKKKIWTKLSTSGL